MTIDEFTQKFGRDHSAVHGLIKLQQGTSKDVLAMFGLMNYCCGMFMMMNQYGDLTLEEAKQLADEVNNTRWRASNGQTGRPKPELKVIK